MDVSGEGGWGTFSSLCFLKMISKGFLSPLNLQMLGSFTFSFYGGNGFRVAPVSYPATSHCSHLFKSECELVRNTGNMPYSKHSEWARGVRLWQWGWKKLYAKGSRIFRGPRDWNNRRKEMMGPSLDKGNCDSARLWNVHWTTDVKVVLKGKGVIVCVLPYIYTYTYMEKEIEEMINVCT